MLGGEEIVDWFKIDEEDEPSLPKLELKEPLPELFRLALSALLLRLGVRLRLDARLLWQCFNMVMCVRCSVFTSLAW